MEQLPSHSRALVRATEALLDIGKGEGVDPRVVACDALIDIADMVDSDATMFRLARIALDQGR